MNRYTRYMLETGKWKKKLTYDFNWVLTQPGHRAQLKLRKERAVLDPLLLPAVLRLALEGRRLRKPSTKAYVVRVILCWANYYFCDSGKVRNYTTRIDWDYTQYMRGQHKPGVIKAVLEPERVLTEDSRRQIHQWWWLDKPLQLAVDSVRRLIEGDHKKVQSTKRAWKKAQRQV